MEYDIQEEVDNLDEIWKPLKDYIDYYLISNTGKVKSLRRNRLLKCTPKNTVILCVDYESQEVTINELLLKNFEKYEILYAPTKRCEKQFEDNIIEGELWKPMLNYEDLYEVSNLGRIKSVTRNNIDSIGRNVQRRSQIIKSIPKKIGYCFINVYRDGKRYKYNTHKIVALTWIPNPENKYTINHINGVKHDNRVENLEWCTVKENVHHAIATGLSKRKGTDNTNACLDEKQVVEIRSSYIKKKGNIKKLSEKYKVSTSIISDVVNNRTYNNI